MDRVVENNLRLMESNEYGGMRYILGAESINGYAGEWKKYPCISANFLFDPNTGAIGIFTNYGDVPEQFGSFSSAIFRLACKFERGKKPEYTSLQKFWYNIFGYPNYIPVPILTYYIIEYIPTSHRKRSITTTRVALDILGKTMDSYNALYGFNP